MSKEKKVDAMVPDENTDAAAEAIAAKRKQEEEEEKARALAMHQRQMDQRLQKKFTKYTMLIAEDDASLREALVFEAENRGFKVVQATDGAEASRKAQTQCFDAILIDMNLPKKLGHEVVSEVRSSGESLKSVIVVLSGYLKKEVVVELKGKIEKAFTKPADVEVVIDAIATLIEEKAPKKKAA